MSATVNMSLFKRISLAATVAAVLFCGSSAQASCTSSPAQIQADINADIRPGISGGILANTLQGLLDLIVNCYVPLVGFSSASPSVSISSTAAFESALSSNPGFFYAIQNVTVLAVNTPSPYYGTCGVTYVQNASSTGTFGEIYGAGYYWTPQYQTTPSVLACQFPGIIGGAGLPQGGTWMTASSNGTNTITLTAPQTLQVGWNVASIDWHSQGAAAIPLSTVTGGSGSSWTLSNT